MKALLLTTTILCCYAGIAAAQNGARGGGSSAPGAGNSSRAEIAIVATVVGSSAGVVRLSGAGQGSPGLEREELGIAAQVEQDVLVDLSEEGLGAGGDPAHRDRLLGERVLRLKERPKELPSARLALPPLGVGQRPDGRKAAVAYRLVLAY